MNLYELLFLHHVQFVFFNQYQESMVSNLQQIALEMILKNFSWTNQFPPPIILQVREILGKDFCTSEYQLQCSWKQKAKVCYYMIIYLLVTLLHIIISNSTRAVSTETHKTAKPVSLTDQQPSYHWQIVAQTQLQNSQVTTASNWSKISQCFIK